MLGAPQGLPLGQEAHGKDVEAVVTDDRCALSPLTLLILIHVTWS